MVADARQDVQPLVVAIKCTEDLDATALFVPLGLTFHVRVTDLEVHVGAPDQQKTMIFCQKDWMRDGEAR